MVKPLQILFLIVFGYGIYCDSYAQEFIWPTDASQLMTSSFGEFRSGHFHAGIDLKTWGQTGYKIFAVRPGYVMRVRVSPFGYGRALYLKCDTGEIILYGHLKGFTPEIEQLVKAEQKQAGQFSVDLHFKAEDLPVVQGQVLGYTGDTGAGPAHLHFEMRDAYNAPINALTRGYKIEDTIAPRPTAICFSPLDGNSLVENDVQPVVLPLQNSALNRYQVSQAITISGRVGLSLSCYDEANNAANRFSPYKICVLINDREIFATQYDRFSYDLTSQIFLDRDFRLLVQGKGTYHKLFRDIGNKMEFYSRPETWAGVLTTDPADRSHNGIHRNAHFLPPGQHTLQIEIMDFNENRSLVLGTLQVVEEPEIAFTVAANERGEKVAVIERQNQLPVHKIQIWGAQNQAGAWRLIREWENPAVNSERLSELKPINIPIQVGGNGSTPGIYKAVARTIGGSESKPAFFVSANAHLPAIGDLHFSLEHSFYEDFLHLELKATEVVPGALEVIAHGPGGKGLQIPMRQVDRANYRGTLIFDEEMLSPMIIQVTTKDVGGRQTLLQDTLHFYPASTRRPGFMTSQDHMCRVAFQPRSIYKFFIARLEEAPIRPRAGFETVGKAYKIEPDDVPLREGARISLRYPAQDPQPDKLAIYWWNRIKGTWNFLDNKIDVSERMVSGTVSSFGTYTLVRDLEPPSIFAQYPADNAIIANRKPRLMAHLRDSLSGVRSEHQMAMYLDGQKVIAEYDPDTLALFYTPDEPLTSGEHTMIVWAQDRCGNETRRTTRFSIR